jgi:hypothetical protein
MSGHASDQQAIVALLDRQVQEFQTGKARIEEILEGKGGYFRFKIGAK